MIITVPSYNHSLLMQLALLDTMLKLIAHVKGLAHEAAGTTPRALPAILAHVEVTADPLPPPNDL
jgi:hypothetical protein